MAIANITNNILTDSGIATSSLLPYTGATANVNLGVYNLTANKLIAGGASVDNVATFTTFDGGVATQLIGSTGNLKFFPFWNPSIGARINAENSAGSAYIPLSFYATTINLNAPTTLTGALNGTTATFSGLGTFNQLTITGATAGRIFYAQTGGVVSQSGNLNWDNTNEMLGVGTPNPTAVITAFSTNAATQFKAAGTAPAFTFSQSLTTSTYACVFGLATSANHFITGTAAGDMAIANQSATAGAIVFGTGTAEKMRMSSSGNFGIGTSTPVQPLQLGLVSVIAQDANSMYIGANFGNGTGGNYIRSQFANQIHFDSALGFINFKVAGSGTAGNAISYTTAMAITSGGNVGIGTSSPSSTRLDVVAAAGGTALVLRMRSNDDYSFLQFRNNAATEVISEIYSNRTASNTGSLIFATNNGGSSTERMRITSGGDVLFGTSTYGGIGISIRNPSAYNTGQLACVSGDNAEDMFYFFSNTTTLAGIIGVNGNTTSYYSVSDYRAKQDLKDFSGLDVISKFKMYDFEWILDGTRNFGGIAHEIQEVLPYAVTGDKDGERNQAVDYSKIVPILVKAIQELNEKIKQLENK